MKNKKELLAKLIVGMISNNTEFFEKASRLLVKKFGKIDFESSILDFNFTNYYEKEFGRNLKRKFISFKELVRQDHLAGIKNLTIKIEKQLTDSAWKRKVNLDPGLLTDSKLVLASTKDFSHRIYLGNFIFAELTLSFQNKAFAPFPWTYPDYKTKDYIDFFNHARNLYMKKKMQSGNHRLERLS